MSAQHDQAVSPAEWKLVCTQRAVVYGWLSTLYANELSGPMLGSYLAGRGAPLLGGLAAIGLGAEVSRFEAALEALRDIPLARLELAADFAQIFLLDAKAGAPPYASMYEGDDPQFCGTAEAQMRNFLAASGLSIDPRFREPADHLAVYLALMRHLLEQHQDARDIAATAVDQAAFLHDALLGWLPKFVQRCQQARPQVDFYPALAALLLAFVRQDACFLRDVAGHDA